MSFYKYKDIIEEGDLVLAFISRGIIKPFTVTKGELVNTRFGRYEHDKMIGLRYGQQIAGMTGTGFIHLLHPSAELWTLLLPHRTQIVYTPDSLYIVQRMGITSSLRVIEAGTGLASFTHAFARTVGPDGRLFSYEFHEPRYQEAKRELMEHGLSRVNTTIAHRDVCLDGFDVPIDPEFASSIDAEAVFLDLPAPWQAIPHLQKVVSNTRQVSICCFSPCIEQVDKTIHALQQNGWTSIQMVEVAGKRWEARQEMVRDVRDVVKRLKDIQSRKNQGIERLRAGMRKDQTPADDDAVTDEPPAKIHNHGKGFNPFGRGIRIKQGDLQFKWLNVTKVEPEIKSHTSYLTFAYLNPQSI